MKVRDDVEIECNEEPGENKRARSSRRPKKNQLCDTGAISQAGERTKSNAGGVCGMHTLKDLLTVDYEETDKNYLRNKRGQTKGLENIAAHCVKCGIEF